MTSSVTVTDRGLTALTRRLAAVGRGYTLTVGVHAEQGAATAVGGGKATLAEVATINEYGLGHVPERSFIRDWYDQRLTENQAALRSIGIEVLKGTYTVDIGLGRLGALFQGQIQARISAGIAPPNAPSTIARKGSSVPLINYGQLWSSILWIVQKDG